ncbi:uncharacterized protein LOC106161930 [Lingula anatina]|uniref:Uncharacterized protein LOC106161930 n=1 Tax=Lingula anatina TaxID=7574 RepID=A0A1S3I8E1_LINAN|nr:uncharacterized protein LOC106161930 [Lingula anatina]|eukprot:XP_013394463.1 uncharacterized protein LOC106161930 [Lingula anatina]
MMLDPSKTFAKQCIPKTMSACSTENERCLSPALALLNVGYQLQMALTHSVSLNISGDMLGVCRVFRNYLSYFFHTSSNIAWMFKNEWVLQPRGACSKPTVDQMKMAPYSNVVVIMHRILVLQKQISWYYDGVRMLETMKNRINDILHAKKATVPYNGVEFNVRVILDDTVPCGSNEGLSKVEPPLPDKTAGNSGNPRSYTRWMAFTVIWFTWPVFVHIIICELIS